jgi:class 3 adenylate cyclase
MQLAEQRCRNHRITVEAAHRYEGYVAQALGDGIFALFSAPIAHEDHPQRALYTALLMQEESLYLTQPCRYRCFLDSY